jgi:hypothetical protein
MSLIPEIETKLAEEGPRTILGGVDHLFRLGVKSMYHEVVYLGVQLFLKTFVSTRQVFPLARLFVIGMSAPLRSIIM